MIITYTYLIQVIYWENCLYSTSKMTVVSSNSQFLSFCQAQILLNPWAVQLGGTSSVVYDSLLLSGVGCFSRGYYILGKSDKMEVGNVMQYVTHLANMKVQKVANNNWSVWKFGSGTMLMDILYSSVIMSHFWRLILSHVLGMQNPHESLLNTSRFNVYAPEKPTHIGPKSNETGRLFSHWTCPLFG